MSPSSVFPILHRISFCFSVLRRRRRRCMSALSDTEARRLGRKDMNFPDRKRGEVKGALLQVCTALLFSHSYTAHHTARLLSALACLLVPCC